MAGAGIDMDDEVEDEPMKKLKKNWKMSLSGSDEMMRPYWQLQQRQWRLEQQYEPMQEEIAVEQPDWRLSKRFREGLRYLLAYEIAEPMNYLPCCCHSCLGCSLACWER